MCIIEQEGGGGELAGRGEGEGDPNERGKVSGGRSEVLIQGWDT